MSQPAQHDVTICCPRGGQELFGHLRAGAHRHLVGRMQLTTDGPCTTIALVTRDLDAIRAVLNEHAPNATSMRIED